MTTLAVETARPNAASVEVTNEALIVELSNGRAISAPVARYPRLLNGNRKERKNWRLIGRGDGIHWEDLDEDISVDNLIAGKSSSENRSSARRWIDSRNSPKES